MDAKEQLQEVNHVLDRLTRFKHLNGWAAVAAGILCTAAYLLICNLYHVPLVLDNAQSADLIGNSELIQYTFLIAGLLISGLIICGGIILISLPKDLTRAAWRNLWRIIQIFAIYIITGGLVVFGILNQASFINLGLVRVIPPLMCIFYGLAQLHVSHISQSSLKTLGYLMLICGITGILYPAIGWFMWGIGFGLLHILAGIVMTIQKRFE